MYFLNDQTIAAPMPTQTDDCLFVGGPLHDRIESVPTEADAIYLTPDGSVLRTTGYVGGKQPDYSRYDGSNVFAHLTAAPEFVENYANQVNDERRFVPHSDQSTDLDALEDELVDTGMGAVNIVLDYISGMKDACDMILERFSCPNCRA